jgi:hypothetical protein
VSWLDQRARYRPASTARAAVALLGDQVAAHDALRAAVPALREVWAAAGDVEGWGWADALADWARKVDRLAPAADMGAEARYVLVLFDPRV